MNCTLHLSSATLEVAGTTVVSATSTPRGWRWYSNAGRVGRKIDYKSKEAALRGAAKTLVLLVAEVI